MLAPRIIPPPVEWLDLFLRSSHRRQYPQKATIINHEALAETLFYIVDGSVTVVAEGEGGKEIVLAYLHKGDFFGEMGLFEKNAKRSAWIIVRSKTCEVAEMQYDQFRRLSAEQPDLLFELTRQVASRLRKASTKVADMVFLDVKQRVARTLIDLAHTPDAITHPDGHQIHITRQEIARIVGCSREMVGRVLKELQEPENGEPLIHARGKKMVVFGTR